jgi:ribosomal protein S7
MSKAPRTLGSFLRYYYRYCQNNIVLVYRGKREDNWSKRCLYLDSNFHATLGYNHRTIMDCEVIFEYDEPDPKLNERLVAKVINKLKVDNIKYARWFSGNKSQHVHILLKSYDVRNPALFKNVIMRHYGTFYIDDKNNIWEKEGVGRRKLYPDLKLASTGHLIRAEYGIHEKTQDNKELIFMSKEYPCKSKLPMHIFDQYQKAQELSVKQRVNQTVAQVAESETVKKLLNSVLFREGMNDGRERIMYQLIQVLKHKFKPKGEEGKKQLTNLMWDWYKYSSTQGLKMTQEDVRRKVVYHWSHHWPVTEQSLKKTIEEVGGTL